MKKSWHIAFATLIIFLITSCDYNKIKRENEELKERNSQLEELFTSLVQQAEEAEQQKKDSNYAFVYIKYQVVSGGIPVSYISDIFTISKLIDYDDETMILDEHGKKLTYAISPPVILKRELLTFSSYSEASDARVNKK